MDSRQYTKERRCKICGNRWMTPKDIDDIDPGRIPDDLDLDTLVDILYCDNCEFISFAVNECVDCDDEEETLH